MPHKKTLILSIDGLGTRDLGAYGNTWIETPSFNQLASRSILFEHVLTNSTRLDLSLASMVAGRNASRVGLGASLPHPVLEAIRQNGVATLLLSDAPQSFPPDITEIVFDRLLNVDSPSGERPAPTWEETHCASFFAQLLDARRKLPDEHFLWAHYAGLSLKWDAPYEWRERMVEEDEPAPPTWTSPPQATSRERDPDEQLRLYQAMAAEIQVLDACLGILMSEISAESDSRFGLVSPRGYPLGEHGIVGLNEDVLYSESTSVPLIIADFESAIGWRSQNLVQPSLLAEVLQTWLSPIVGELAWRETLPIFSANDSIAYCKSGNGSALRTNDWMLIDNTDRRELYAKPDDRREYNDVSTRCPEVVEQLLALSKSQDESENSQSLSSEEVRFQAPEPS